MHNASSEAIPNTGSTFIIPGHLPGKGITSIIGITTQETDIIQDLITEEESIIIKKVRKTLITTKPIHNNSNSHKTFSISTTVPNTNIS